MRRTDRGSAAVEAAVVLPMLLLIALGTIDLGRFSHGMVAVSNAARVGAQHGSKNLASALDLPGIEAAVRSEMTSVRGATSSNPTIETQVINEGTKGTSLKVTVRFQFESIIRYPALPQSMMLTRSVHMRVLPN